MEMESTSSSPSTSFSTGNLAMDSITEGERQEDEDEDEREPSQRRWDATGPTRARELFHTALQAGPQPQVSVALAELEVREGDYEAARQRLREGLAKAGMIVIIDRRCVKLVKHAPMNTKYTAADRQTKDRPGQGTGGSVSPLLLAWARLEEHHFGEPHVAFKLLDCARVVDPTDVKVGTALAQHCMRNGNLARARTILEQYAQLPNSAIQNRHGSALYNIWVSIEARKASVSLSSDLDGDDTMGIHSGRVSTSVNPSMEKAINLAREGIARFPGEASLYQTLGTILSRMVGVQIMYIGTEQGNRDLFSFPSFIFFAAITTLI